LTSDFSTVYNGVFVKKVLLLLLLPPLLLLNVDFKRRNSPSARCASAANAIGSGIDINNVNDWLVFDTFAR
jgi:hypothetical protein